MLLSDLFQVTTFPVITAEEGSAVLHKPLQITQCDLLIFKSIKRKQDVKSDNHQIHKEPNILVVKWFQVCRSRSEFTHSVSAFP